VMQYFTWVVVPSCRLCSQVDLMLALRIQIKTKSNSVAWVLERTILNERSPLVGEVNASFADRECHVVSATDPYGSILGFLDRSRYFFFQVAPQLYSRG
jgi:hypothetical protein